MSDADLENMRVCLRLKVEPRGSLRIAQSDNAVLGCSGEPRRSTVSGWARIGWGCCGWNFAKSNLRNAHEENLD